MNREQLRGFPLVFVKANSREGSVLVRVSIIDIPLEAAETQVFLLSSLYIVLSALCTNQ